MKDLNQRQLEKLAKKNREKSQKQYEEESGKPSTGATKKRRKELEETDKTIDPRYEVSNRLFTEMKKKDRP